MFSLYAFNCLNCGVLAMSCCPVPQRSSRTPSPVSAVSHRRATLAHTGRHAGGVAVTNSSEVGSCLFSCRDCVQCCMTAAIHPVQVSFSKKNHWNPPKSALSRYRLEISHSLEIQGRKHTRHFLRTCASELRRYVTRVFNANTAVTTHNDHVRALYTHAAPAVRGRC